MGSHLLVATGRRPNTDDLDLHQAGVEADERGYIKVDGKLDRCARHLVVGAHRVAPPVRRLWRDAPTERFLEPDDR